MKKEIPLKNYVILAVIVVLTVLMVFYARNWYETVRQYNNTNSPILSVINEINVDEISNYTLENPKFVLYVPAENDEDVTRFEKSFKKYVINKNLDDSIIYIDGSKVDADTFNDELKKYADDSLKNKIDVSNTSMYIFDNGKITNIIEDADELDNNEIDALFKVYKVIDNA